MIDDGTINRIKKLFERLNILADVSSGFDDDLNEDFILIEIPEDHLETFENVLDEMVQADEVVDHFLEEE